MSLTRSQIESDTNRRIGRLMALVGLDGTTQDGTNADIRQPLRSSLRVLGFEVADPIDVTDSDVSVVTGYYVDRLLDLIEYELIDLILSRWYEAYLTTPPIDKEILDAQAKRLQQRAVTLKALIEKPLRPRGSTELGPIGGTARIPNTDYVVNSETNWFYP